MTGAVRGGWLAAALALTAGCAAQEAAPPGQAAPQRFEVSPAGAVGIAVLAGMVVLAVMVSQDDAVSFD